MNEKQPEALKWADAIEAAYMPQLAQFLRTQHADIERKDALLRQALEALDKSWPDDDATSTNAYLDCKDAIRRELSA